MQQGITILEFLISVVLMMLAVPCIINSSLKDYKIQSQNKLKFLDKLNFEAKSCQNKSYNGFNILKCENKNNEIFYKIK